MTATRLEPSPPRAPVPRRPPLLRGWTTPVLVVAGVLVTLVAITALVTAGSRLGGDDPRPNVIDTATCVVRDLRVSAPRSVRMSEPFTVRITPVGLRAAAGGCPVTVSLGGDPHLSINGAERWDLATSEPTWSVTATGLQPTWLDITVTSVLPCRRQCAAAVPLRHQFVVSKSPAHAAAKQALARFVGGLTATARKDAVFREGDGSKVPVDVGYREPLAPLGFTDVRLHVASLTVPGDGPEREVPLGPAGERAASFNFVVVAGSYNDFDAFVAFEVRARWRGLDLVEPWPAAVRFPVEGEPWESRLQRYLNPMNTLIAILGGIAGLTWRRWRKKSQTVPRPRRGGVRPPR